VPKLIPIRFKDEQVERLEQAASLAGYKHLSTYIRDRLFSEEKADRNQEAIDPWVDLERISFQLERIERNQKTQQTTLAIAVYLLRKAQTAGTLNGLRAELANLGATDDVVNALLPELANDIERITGDE
jgi:hypothetical protein